MPSIGIVIPMKDASGEFPKRCLAHIARTTKHLDVEVVSIERNGPGFRYSRSINEGLRQFATKDFVVTMNDDVFVDDGWLDALLDAHRAHPNVGIWGSVLRYPEPARGLQHAGGWLETSPGAYLARATRERWPFYAWRVIREKPAVLQTGHYLHVDPAHRLDFITGACQLMTRACLDKVGPYDEDYEFCFEDIDHSLRALENGFEMGLACNSTGIHVDHAAKVPSERQIRSRITFNEKWTRERVRAATLHRIGVHASYKEP